MKKGLMCGVGITDIKVSSNGVYLKSYLVWQRMIIRCYSGKYKNYTDCSVSDDWLTFSNFKNDVESMIGFDECGWHLDKDLISKGNRVYSKDMCCFLPKEINVFLTYRKSKHSDYPIGVSFLESKSKFISQIRTGNGGRKTLGLFNTSEEAFCSYKEFKEKLSKDLAFKWDGLIDDRARDSLLSFTVNIED
ncbi:HNH family homing endonuclease [Acinetobacter phage vB_AbaM_D22]|nr:HNH family homing endonuclease [Acinetobacter phage vB_AbaM_D22]